MVRPPSQQRLKDPRGCALADRHTAGDPDDEGDARGVLAEEGVGGLVQVLGGGDA
jgi:hypothetical protein